MVFAGCVHIDEIGKLVNVNGFSLFSETTSIAGFVNVSETLEWGNCSRLRRNAVVGVKEGLEGERRGARIFDVNVGAELMLGKGHDVCELERVGELGGHSR